MPTPRPASRRATVVAAVIERNGAVLICQRSIRDSHPLRWEFPGGKVERGESLHGALRRELKEELSIRAKIGPEIARGVHQYRDRSPLELVFFRVTEFQGEPKNRTFEQIRWESPVRLPEYDFLEADSSLVLRLATGPSAGTPRPAPGSAGR